MANPTNKKGAVLRARIVQRAVGQGGLCEGWVEDDGVALRWVYDCGSNQTETLAREVRKVTGPLDVLFISHLHADHVSGVDLLMRQTTAFEVVLPYLNDLVRLFTIAREAANGLAAGLFMAFMSDPAGWLRERGAERVTFIRGDDGQGPSVDERALFEKRPTLTGGIEARWSHEPRQAAGQPRGVRIAPAGATLDVVDGAGRCDWTFAPHVYPPSKRLQRAFQAELMAQFPGLSIAQIVRAVWWPAGQAKLQVCYDKVWIDHNLVSMNLYMGPPPHAPTWSSGVAQPQGHSNLHWRQSDGWLSTGDAQLKAPMRRAAFQRFYAGYLSRVAVLVTPHHGAANSWDDDILTGMSNLHLGIAAAGPNSYGHPHRAVRDALTAFGRPLVQVDEMQSLSIDLRT